MTNFENTINIIDTVFGIKRIVNAKSKKIIDLENNKEIDGHSCFEFWDRGKECTNCISMRAVIDNKSYSKFETVDDKLYMIIASPVKINDDTYVVELVKDVSEDTMSSYFSTKIHKELEAEVIRLNKLVVTDELTSIYNRRYINEKLPYAINKLSSSSNSLAVVIVDVDKFKSINDRFGHIYGDYVLRDISSILNNFACDNNGWTARYGGDEFVMVFENILDDNTETMVEKLKELISQNNFIYDEININVTCSFGHTIVNESNVDFENLMNYIDKKLFIDKKNLIDKK